MPLPFRQRPHLPDNRTLAETRLNHLKEVLQRWQKYKKDYTTYMKEILERGDVEEVREDELPGEQWYITHQGVDHPKKPDKLRLLWLLCKVWWHKPQRAPPSRDGYDKQPHWFPLTVQTASDSSHVWYRENVCQSTCDGKDVDANTQPQDYRMKAHLFGVVGQSLSNMLTC